jgi:hypothetical protein
LHLIRLFLILRSYQSPIIRASLHEAGTRSCIPPKSNRKAKIRWNRRMYREQSRDVGADDFDDVAINLRGL